MSAELQRLQSQVNLQQKVFDSCNPGKLKGARKTLAETWLAETGLLLEGVQRDVARLADPPPAIGMNQAWARYQQVYTALSPIASTMTPNMNDQDRSEAAYQGLLSVANRLLFVLRFLGFQLVLAVVLLVYTVYLFSSFNPQTALTGEQLEARRLIQSHVLRIEKIVDREARLAAAQPPPAPKNVSPSAPSNASPPAPHTESPNVAAVRGEVEGLAASLEELRLAQRDVSSINLWLQSVLVSIDGDPPDFDSAKASLRGLADLLDVGEDTKAPSLIRLAVLGSLLGMITITIHLNWKFRNRWDTVGFLPWYVTKLIGAPVLTIAAVGLLSQFTLTKNLNEASNGFSDLGLRGADPLLFFSIMILTGLFSNRLFDWLRAFAESKTATQAKPGGAPTQAETAAANTNPAP
jgi:hypothetical protein